MTDDQDDNTDQPGTNRKGKKPYRVPPAEHRFKPGQSGNPHGRPKGRKSLTTLIQEVLDTETAYREGGRTKIATKGKLVAETVVHMSLQKNLKAIELLLQHDQPQHSNDNAEEGAVSVEDQAILERHFGSEPSEAAAPYVEVVSQRRRKSAS